MGADLVFSAVAGEHERLGFDFRVQGGGNKLLLNGQRVFQIAAEAKINQPGDSGFARAHLAVIVIEVGEVQGFLRLLTAKSQLADEKLHRTMGSPTSCHLAPARFIDEVSHFLGRHVTDGQADRLGSFGERFELLGLREVSATDLPLVVRRILTVLRCE